MENHFFYLKYSIFAHTILLNYIDKPDFLNERINIEQNFPISQYINHIYLTPLFSNFVYCIESDTIKAKYYIDFGAHQISDNFYQNLNHENANKILHEIYHSDYAHSIEHFIETENYIYFIFAYKKDDYSVYYNKKTTQLSLYRKTTLEFANHPTTHDIAQTVSTKHPQKDYIASVFFNFPQIDLYNEQGRYKTIFYKKMIHPQEISTSQRDEEYFSCICCNSNYIFALYHPTPTSAKRISEILIFSWEGHPIGKYVIPFASYLLVDEDNKCIFALNPNKETFNTSIYHLNNMSPTNLK